MPLPPCGSESAALDASLAGIGGCPFAPAATGNVATEDLVYTFDRMGLRTGLDLDGLINDARWLLDELGKDCRQRVVARRHLSRRVWAVRTAWPPAEWVPAS